VSLLLCCRELILFCRELILFCRKVVLFCREFFLVFTVVHKHESKNMKVQLTPHFFFPLLKSTSFLDYFSEKIILIDKIPAFPQAFKVVTFAAILGSA